MLKKHRDPNGIKDNNYKTTTMKNSRRGRIIDLLTFGKTENDILAILDKEFPKGVFITSNKQAIAGTKWDLDIKSKKKPKK
jgi:hypothetical protein